MCNITENYKTDKQVHLLALSEHLTFYCFTLQNTTTCPSELSLVDFLGWLFLDKGHSLTSLYPH